MSWLKRDQNPIIQRLRRTNATLRDKLRAIQDERDFYIKLIARQRTVADLEQRQIDKAIARMTPPPQRGEGGD